MRAEMMKTLIGPLLLALAGAACGGSASTPTTPTATAPSVTEEFTGTLNLNGGASFPFVTGSAGLITATLTTLGDNDTTSSVGLSMGTWNGTACAVSSIHNDNAGQGSAVIGQATGSGSLCARVYDVGKIAASITFKVTVVHP